MQTIRSSASLLGLACLLALSPLDAQESTFEWPRSSPRTEIQQRVAATDIELSYSRPSTRGRTIFGGLVPFGDVWRTGANSATKVSFSTPVSVEGNDLPAGTYELFTIPGEQEWIVIFHEHKSQWGSYAYDSANDVARVSIKPVQLDHLVETLTLSIDSLTASSAVLNIAWEHVRVPVNVSIDVRETILPHLEAALKAEGERPYFRAAMFYFENNLDIDRAAELMAKALESNPDSFPALYRYALILEQKGDREGATAAAERSKKVAADVPGEELREEYIRLNKTVLDRLRSN